MNRKRSPDHWPGAFSRPLPGWQPGQGLARITPLLRRAVYWPDGMQSFSIAAPDSITTARTNLGKPASCRTGTPLRSSAHTRKANRLAEFTAADWAIWYG